MKKLILFLFILTPLHSILSMEDSLKLPDNVDEYLNKFWDEVEIDSSSNTPSAMIIDDNWESTLNVHASITNELPSLSSESQIIIHPEASIQQTFSNSTATNSRKRKRVKKDTSHSNERLLLNQENNDLINEIVDYHKKYNFKCQIDNCTSHIKGIHCFRNHLLNCHIPLFKCKICDKLIYATSWKLTKNYENNCITTDKKHQLMLNDDNTIKQYITAISSYLKKPQDSTINQPAIPLTKPNSSSAVLTNEQSHLLQKIMDHQQSTCKINKCTMSFNNSKSHRTHLLDCHISAFKCKDCNELIRSHARRTNKRCTITSKAHQLIRNSNVKDEIINTMNKLGIPYESYEK